MKTPWRPGDTWKGLKANLEVASLEGRSTHPLPRPARSGIANLGGRESLPSGGSTGHPSGWGRSPAGLTLEVGKAYLQVDPQAILQVGEGHL